MENELALAGNVAALKSLEISRLPLEQNLEILKLLPETLDPHCYKELFGSWKSTAEESLVRNFVLARALEIDESTGLVGHALDLVKIAKVELGVSGLDALLGSLETVCDLVYSQSAPYISQELRDAVDQISLSKVYPKAPVDWLPLYFKNPEIFSSVEKLQHHLLLHVVPALERAWHAHTSVSNTSIPFSKYCSLQVEALIVSSKASFQVSEHGNLVLAAFSVAKNLFLSEQDLNEVAIVAVQVLERFEPLSKTNREFLLRATSVLGDTQGAPNLSEKMTQYRLWLGAADSVSTDMAAPFNSVAELVRVSTDEAKQIELVDTLIKLAQNYKLVNSVSISKQFETLLTILDNLQRQTTLLSKLDNLKVYRPVLLASLQRKLRAIVEVTLKKFSLDDTPEGVKAQVADLLYDCAVGMFRDPAQFSLSALEYTVSLFTKTYATRLPPRLNELLLIARAVHQLAADGLVFKPGNKNKALFTPMSVLQMDNRIEVLTVYLKRVTFSSGTKIRGPESFTGVMLLAFWLEARLEPFSVLLQTLAIVLCSSLQLDAEHQSKIFEDSTSCLNRLAFWFAQIASVCPRGSNLPDEFWDRLHAVATLGQSRIDVLGDVVSWCLKHCPASRIQSFLSSCSSKDSSDLTSDSLEGTPEWQWANRHAISSELLTVLQDWQWERAPFISPKVDLTLEANSDSQGERSEVLGDIALWMLSANAKKVAQAYPENMFQIFMRVDTGWALEVAVFWTLMASYESQWSKILKLVEQLPSSPAYPVVVSLYTQVTFFSRLFLSQHKLEKHLPVLYTLDRQDLSDLWQQAGTAILFDRDAMDNSVLTMLETFRGKILNLETLVSGKNVDGILAKMIQRLSLDARQLPQDSAALVSFILQYARTADETQYEDAKLLADQLCAGSLHGDEVVMARLEYLLSESTYKAEFSADILQNFLSEVKQSGQGAFVKKNFKSLLQKMLALHGSVCQTNYLAMIAFYDFYGHLLGCLGTVKQQRLEQLQFRHQLLLELRNAPPSPDPLTLTGIMDALTKGREGILYLFIPLIKSMDQYRFYKERVLPLVLKLRNNLSFPEEANLPLAVELDIKLIQSGLARFMISQIEPFLIQQLMQQDEKVGAGMVQELTEALNSLGNDVLPTDNSILPLARTLNGDPNSFADSSYTVGSENNECLIS